MREHGQDDYMADERLGLALRGELHALVADLNPSRGLMARVDALASERTSLRGRAVQRIRRRPILLGVPVPLAAIAATLVAVLGGGSAPVTAGGLSRMPNGDIWITVNQEMDVTDTNAELRHYGVRSIIVVPFSASCPLQPDMNYMDEKLYPAPKIILPRAAPRGYTWIMGARIIGKNLVQEASAAFKDHVPNCISTHAFNVVGAP